MSQHNIVGSEAFNRTPPLMIRKVRTRTLRRHQTRRALAYVTGLGIAVVGGFIAAAAVFGPGLAG